APGVVRPPEGVGPLGLGLGVAPGGLASGGLGPALLQGAVGRLQLLPEAAGLVFQPPPALGLAAREPDGPAPDLGPRGRRGRLGPGREEATAARIAFDPLPRAADPDSEDTAAAGAGLLHARFAQGPRLHHADRLPSAARAIRPGPGAAGGW